MRGSGWAQSWTFQVSWSQKREFSECVRWEVIAVVTEVERLLLYWDSRGEKSPTCGGVEESG